MRAKPTCLFVVPLFFLPCTGFAQLPSSNSITVNAYEANIEPLQSKPGIEPALNSKLSIRFHGKEVYSANGTNFRFGSRGSDPVQEQLIKPGNDITGDGIPELVVSEFTGRSECCLMVHVFSLGDKIKNYGNIDARYAEETRFLKSPNQGLLYKTKDFTFAGWGGKGFTQPAPEIYLRPGLDGYHLALDLMRHPAPPEEALQKRAQEIQQELTKIEATHRGADLPVSLTGAVLGLIYTGNAKSSRHFLELCWPAGRPGLDIYWEDLHTQLKRSPYWKDLQPTLTAS
jgi:hypothetical protein